MGFVGCWVRRVVKVTDRVQGVLGRRREKGSTISNKFRRKGHGHTVRCVRYKC